MCFWGAPVPDHDHARHALDAAMEMVEVVRELGPTFVARGWPEIRIGVGLNTGEMSVGNMGSEFRLAYTVLGDAVNLGSRLEGQTKNYGVDLIISESTREAVPEYECVELDRIRVKGKDAPVTIYEPLGVKDQISRELRLENRHYMNALKLYRAQQWDSAEIQFINLKSGNPSRYLYQLYIERIKVFRSNPPEKHWDGVFTHRSK